MEHASHCRSRLLSAHTFDSPSPCNPVFAIQGSIAPSNLQATTRQTRSKSQTTTTPASSAAAAPVSATLSVSASGLQPLMADESKRYIVASELMPRIAR
eukprot:6198180-Pleurochrysis_carterae.AAC.1